MSKRQILYIVLSFVTTVVLLLIVAVAILLLQKPQVTIVWTKGKEAPAEVKAAARGKWEGKEKLAIKMVKETQVPDPEPDKRKRRKKGEEPETISIDALAERNFFQTRFKLAGLELVGWEARYLKGSYYFVSYNRRDNLVNLGPVWLVDVSRKEVMPKNILARAAMNPEAVNAEQHFAHERQVIGSIANHSFTSGVKLGGIMLIHFSNLTEDKAARKASGKAKGAKEAKEAEDQIVGWTIVHDHGETYRAYFQWTESGEPTYADFEFDYAKKALRSRNLQAANFLNMGNDFQDEVRASIMPSTFKPDAEDPRDAWTGPSRDRCRDKDFKKQCDAMAKILSDASQIEAVEWLLTTQVEGSDAFEQCKRDQRCKWSATTDDNNLYLISYIYNLDKDRGEQHVSWNVNLKSNTITPQDAISQMAFRAVHPRPRQAAEPPPSP